jgi:hypothetical protein
LQRCDDVDFFQIILPTEWPRGLNRDLRTVTWHIHLWTHQRVYLQNMSVGDSIGNSQYIPILSTLYFFFFFPISPLPSRTAANHPFQLSLSFKYKHSSFLYFCMWLQKHRFLWIFFSIRIILTRLYKKSMEDFEVLMYAWHTSSYFIVVIFLYDKLWKKGYKDISLL